MGRKVYGHVSEGSQDSWLTSLNETLVKNGRNPCAGFGDAVTEMESLLRDREGIGFVVAEEAREIMLGDDGDEWDYGPLTTTEIARRIKREFKDLEVANRSFRRQLTAADDALKEIADGLGVNEDEAWRPDVVALAFRRSREAKAAE